MQGWLCQPDPSKGCAACCGLYNYVDHSRPALERLLWQRTRFFWSLPRTEKGLRRYLEEVKALLPSEPLARDIYRCDFVGFLDGDGRRVGCLLHPALHGEDLRDLSPYGRELCSSHLCPSHHYLAPHEQQGVILALDDWYLYGLVITDLDLVRETFRIIADGIGRAVKPQDLEDPELRRALRGFFAFKERWPFKDHRPRLGKYWFSQGEYRLDHPWDDPWDRLLGCLETDPARWEEAGAFLRERLGELVGMFAERLGG